MTLTIEVNDDKALNELKEFLESKKDIQLVRDVSKDIITEPSTMPTQPETTDEERRAILHSLYGSLNMSPERFKEYEAFLHEIRNECE